MKDQVQPTCDRKRLSWPLILNEESGRDILDIKFITWDNRDH